jgi:hypothetical protein
MGHGKQLWPQPRKVRDEDAAVVQHEAIDHRPSFPNKVLIDLLLLGDNVQQVVCLCSKLSE